MDFINIIGTFFDNSIEHVVALAHQIKDLRLNKNQQDINDDLYDQIRITKETKDKCKGYYDNYYSLILNVPVPQIGDWAIVKNLDDNKWYIYKCVVQGYWKATQEEYQSNINLVEYAKRDDIKTINGQTILGGGDLQVGHYNPADSQHDGLMSSENYISLLTIQNETIPQIRESIHNILNLFGDSEVTESIQAILDRYNQIAEFITSLGDNDNGQILFTILKDISDLKDFVSTTEAEFTELKAELTDVKDDLAAIHTILDQVNEHLAAIDHIITDLEASNNERIDVLSQDISNLRTETQNLISNLREETQAAEADLSDRVTQLENNPNYGSDVKHIFLTQEEYDALESYEVDAIYFIIEHIETHSHFGDTFPLIFG